MDDAEFQKLLNAEPPVSIKFGPLQTLVLDIEGFTVKGLRSKRYQRKSVSAFIARGSLNAWSDKGVYFNVENGSPWLMIHKLFSGYDVGIRTVFEGYKSFHQLAQLMNHWRERALAGK